MARMKIGTLARQADVAIDTVRYYERQGLLPAPERTESGYRSYAPGDVARLRFIRRAKTLGFTLGEIGDVDARIAELQRMRGGLERLVSSCPGHGPLEHCPILDALSGDGR